MTQIQRMNSFPFGKNAPSKGGERGRISKCLVIIKLFAFTMLGHDVCSLRVLWNPSMLKLD
jgi:hypothetical protein